MPNGIPNNAFEILMPVRNAAEHVSYTIAHRKEFDQNQMAWRDLDDDEILLGISRLRDALWLLPYRWFRVDPLTYDVWRLDEEKDCCEFYQTSTGATEYRPVPWSELRSVLVFYRGWADLTNDTAAHAHMIAENVDRLIILERARSDVLRDAERDARSTEIERAAELGPEQGGAGEETTPCDTISMGVALERFATSRSTLCRAVKRNNLKSYRPDAAPKNSEHRFSESELARRYKRLA